MSSRKLQTHGPNFSGALVKVSIKSNRAYARIGRTIKVLGLCEHSVASASVIGRLHVPVFRSATTERERGVYGQ